MGGTTRRGTMMMAVLALGLGRAGGAGAQLRPGAPEGVAVTEGIQYGSGDPAQTLDLFLPDPAAKKAATLLVLNHGSGDKGPLVRWFSEHGYTVLFVNLRARGAYPIPVRDAFCAVAWAREHGSELGFDPSEIFAVGHSGGAVLAAHLGAVEDRALYLEGCPHTAPGEGWLQGVVSIAGLFDYRTEQEFGDPHNAYTPRYFGGSREEVPAAWAEASPISWIDGSEPPYLIAHGTADLMVLPLQSQRSASLLGEAGVEVEYLEVPGEGHDGILKPWTFERVADFLDRISARRP